MRIGIIGGGVVGHATARSLVEFHDVRVYDALAERSTHSYDATLKSDLVFVCLPEKEVEGFASSVRGQSVHIVLKSTVPIGTTWRLARDHDLKNLVHSPEFLTARTAVADAHLPTRFIIGVTRYYGKDPVTDMLTELYETRFPGVPIHVMKSDESEAVKLMTNAFFAMKVSFFNNVYETCEKLGLDWNTVRDGILSDGRIARSHTQVPGPDGERGFGGACLPKDTRYLLQHFEGELLNAVLTDNEKRRGDEK